jgi:hypothetical protein
MHSFTAIDSWPKPATLGECETAQRAGRLYFYGTDFVSPRETRKRPRPVPYFVKATAGSWYGRDLSEFRVQPEAGE